MHVEDFMTAFIVHNIKWIFVNINRDDSIRSKIEKE